MWRLTCSCLFLSPPTKWVGDIGMVSFRPSIRPGFLTIIWKSNLSINFKFDYAFVWWVLRIDLLLGHVGPILTLWWPKNDWQWVKMLVSDHYLKKYSCNPIQTWYLHILSECSELICFWAILAKFWPSSGHKNDWKWWFPTVILNTIHAIQFKLGV